MCGRDTGERCRALVVYLVVLDFLRRLFETRRADPVAELSFRMFGEVSIHLLPVLIVAPDPFAVAADWQEAVQTLDS